LIVTKVDFVVGIKRAGVVGIIAWIKAGSEASLVRQGQVGILFGTMSGVDEGGAIGTIATVAIEKIAKFSLLAGSILRACFITGIGTELLSLGRIPVEAAFEVDNVGAVHAKAKARSVLSKVAEKALGARVIGGTLLKTTKSTFVGVCETGSVHKTMIWIPTRWAVCTITASVFSVFVIAVCPSATSETRTGGRIVAGTHACFQTGFLAHWIPIKSVGTVQT
jgi:hypothetical protein